MVLLIALLFLSVPAFADKHERFWQTGTILDMESERFTTYGGTTTQGRVDDNGNINATSTRSSWNHKRETLAIEGKEYIYVVSHVLSWRWSKEVKLVVGGTVEYAIDGDNLIILDDKTREFKMHIDKTILKRKPAPVSAQKPGEQRITTPDVPNYSVVLIKSTPPAADITVDGKYVGSTPSTIRLPTGEHTISVTKDGLKAWQRTMSITPNGNITIDAILEKIP
jgi:hypothetical protein